MHIMKKREGTSESMEQTAKGGNRRCVYPRECREQQPNSAWSEHWGYVLVDEERLTARVAFAQKARLRELTILKREEAQSVDSEYFSFFPNQETSLRTPETFGRELFRSYSNSESYQFHNTVLMHRIVLLCVRQRFRRKEQFDKELMVEGRGSFGQFCATFVKKGCR